jgi:hypothetical protein
MSRKDFVLIAKTILESSEDKEARQRLAAAFINVLAATNSRFNRERFLRASAEGKK